MRTVFVDTAYWAAVIRPRDQWRQATLPARERLGDALLATTDGVLTEVLAGMGGNSTLRQKAVNLVREIMHDLRVEVIPQTRELRSARRKKSIFPP